MAMALLVLPLLAFVAANHATSNDNNNKANSRVDLTATNSEATAASSSEEQLWLERRRAVNGTELTLECPSASHLVRTHMAPDFEHPQLVRRLDWIHEGVLVASFHQDLDSDISQQWWVSSGRFELRRPFFELRVHPVLPQDAGQWRCRLETDPLFAELPQLRSGAHLLVLTRPPVPPKPLVLKHSDHAATLDWAKYAASPAHQPILRFSVLVAQPEESREGAEAGNAVVIGGGGGGGGGSMRVLSTVDNQTSVEVAGLRPNTRYAFSVRAENAVGESAFGPETLFRTIGLPPKKSPEIRSLRNGSSADCVELEWDLPADADQEPTPIVGFRIMVHRAGTGAMREWYVKGGRVRSQTLCSLDPHTDYVLTAEAENGFGYSAGTTAPFRTDQSIPDGPPESVQCRPLPGGTSLSLSWRQPLVPNGPVRAFLIYYKEVPSSRAATQIRLEVGPEEAASKAFAFNLTKLASNRRYKVRLAAATDKGEGPKSEALFVDTDFAAPQDAPKVSNLSFSCDNSLLSLEWTGPALPEGADGIYRISVHSSAARAPRIFNMSAASPSKLLLDQVQLSERLSVTISLRLRSRADPTQFFESPSSAPAHFVLIANGWRCRFRSSACPPAASLPSTAICEHFPQAAAAQQEAALIGQQQPNAAGNDGNGMAAVENVKMDVNMPFIFLIFGAAIALAVSTLFACLLRRRCLLFKNLLANKKRQQQQQQQHRQSGRGSRPGVQKWRPHGGPESVSLVQKANGELTAAEQSVILPPITVSPNGHCTTDGAGRRETTIEWAEQATVSATGEEFKNCCAIEEPDVRVGPAVSVLQFDAYFEAMTADGNSGFRQQFQELELETALLLEHEEEETTGEEEEFPAAADGNASESIAGSEKAKNRYVDIGALPRRSRIRLLDGHGRRHQYINANFVDSCDERRAYIATQAPLPHTFGDFWAMVWQERCQVLVALTNMVESGRRKCDQYWPERVGAQLQVGQFLVTLTAERSNSVFTHRLLQLRRQCGGEDSKHGEEEEAPRPIHQLHFMAWPDHGVPDSPFPLLHFVNYVAEQQQNSISAPAGNNNNNTDPFPSVVHCSAGVGRSGAFILIDSLRRHLLRCDRVDVCGQLRRMRRQRAQLVQTLDQFVFCHEVLRHLVANGITRQPRSHFPNYCRFLFSKCTPSGQQRIQAQFQQLLACPHGLPASSAACSPPNNGCCLHLVGYHRTDEFLLCSLRDQKEAGAEKAATAEAIHRLWANIWGARCQSLAVLDSRTSIASTSKSTSAASPLPDDSQATEMLIKQLLPAKQNNNKDEQQPITFTRIGGNRVLLKRRSSAAADGRQQRAAMEEEKELLVAVHRIETAALLASPWTEIERLQSQLQEQHRGKLAVLELYGPCRRRPSAAAFLFCALQSAACQLEQEGAVDVLLWLASYKHVCCGCWTELTEIELIYRRVLELVELQRALC